MLRYLLQEAIGSIILSYLAELLFDLSQRSEVLQEAHAQCDFGQHVRVYPGWKFMVGT